MKLKKTLAATFAATMLAAACCGSLVACGNKNNDPKPTPDPGITNPDHTPNPDNNNNGVYTITFDAGIGTFADGSNSTTRQTYNGVLGQLPDDPTHAVYTFAGWNTDINGEGTTVTAGSAFSAATTVYAQWTSGAPSTTEYTITFDANGGTLATGTKPMKTVNGKLAELPDDPTPPSVKKRFVGWYTDASIWSGSKVTTSYEFYSATENITVYARYEDINGLWIGNEIKYEFEGTSYTVYAYDVDFSGGVEYEVWYGGSRVTGDAFIPTQSSDKVEWVNDKLKLKSGAQADDVILNVAYKTDVDQLTVNEIILANLQEDDGVYLGQNKVASFTQSKADSVVTASNIIVPTSGTELFTVKFGGKTLNISNDQWNASGDTLTALLARDFRVRAKINSNNNSLTIAAGTYSIRFNYTQDNDYRLSLSGQSTGELPRAAASDYYLVGSSVSFSDRWIAYDDNNNIPDERHFILNGDAAGGDEVYELTVDLYAGDTFKILTAGNQWDDALGGSAFTDWSDYFKDGDNAEVVESGSYTIYLRKSTGPLYVTDCIRNGNAAGLSYTYDVFVSGTMNSWGMTAVDATGIVSGMKAFEVTLAEGDTFGFKSTITGQSGDGIWTGWADYTKVPVDKNNTSNYVRKADDSNNFYAAVAGTYRFTIFINEAGNIMQIEIDFHIA